MSGALGWIEQARAALAQRDYPTAARVCGQVLAVDPENFAALAILCRIFIEKDDREPAEQIIAKLLSRADLIPEQRAEVGRYLAQMGLLGEALKVLRDEGGADPHIPWMRGSVLEAFTDFHGAAAAFEEAARRDPAFHGVGERCRKMQEHIRRNADWGAQVDRIGQRIIAERGELVLTGPFRGMRLGKGADFSWATELIGSYEQELHPVIEGLIARGHRTIIDIGTSGGYYAVGMALRNRQARVIGYEIDDTKRNACAELARSNGVSDRVELRGECTRAGLAALQLDSPALVICDCEGAELDLLQPAHVPLLRGADVLLEAHDFIIPRLEERIVNRFAMTHRITRIMAVAPVPASYSPLLPFLSPAELELAVADFRPPEMVWLVMQPIECHPPA